MPSRPVYRVAAAGLDPRDVRLIEIVFKHSQYNRFEFVFEPALVSDRLDILIANPAVPDGLQAIGWLRTLERYVPVVSAVPRGAPGSARHALSIERLTLQLLPILNRVVEMELPASDSRPVAGTDVMPPTASPTVSPAASQALPEAAVRASLPATDHRAAGLQTRDFLREAARLSRAGDSVRQAAAPAAAQGSAATGRPAEAETPPPSTAGRPISNLVAFPLNAESAAPQIRVLVVDDSPTVRKQLSVAFTRMRIECDAVPGAAEALQRLGERYYDLALVDVVMPEMDGYRLTRQIRRAYRGLPVIILTSRSSPFDLARGALAGCSSYLVKPVPLRQLEAAVARHLRRSLAIDDLRSLVRLSHGPSGEATAPQDAGASVRDHAASAGRAPRSGGQ